MKNGWWFMQTRVLSIGISMLAGICFFAPVSACVWCTPDEPIPLLVSYLQNDAVYQKRTSGLRRPTDSESMFSRPFYQRTQALSSVPYQHQFPERSRFNTEYLNVFYPKAAHCIELFASMCEEAEQRALDDYLVLTHDQPWRYFSNEKEGTQLCYAHIEILADQLEELLMKRPQRPVRRSHVNARNLWVECAAFDADLLYRSVYIEIACGIGSRAELFLERADALVRGLLVGSHFGKRYVEYALLYRQLIRLANDRSLQSKLWWE